ncbi:MAG: hypothetical protein R3Y44_06110 [Rikenellaceae bacterium]
MKYKSLIAVVLLAVVGCIKEPYIGPYDQDQGQLFTLSIESFSDEVISSTRSASSDISIDRGYILFYNSASGAFKGYEAIEDLSLSQSGSTVSFETGANYSTSDKIIAIFNHDTSAALPTDFSAVKSDNLSDYFPLSAEYLSRVEAEMNSGDYSLGMPMYLNDFTDSDRATREVYRSVARMELFIKEGLTIEHDSHTHSIDADNLHYAVVNATSMGSVGIGSSPSYIVESCFDTESFDGVFPHELTEYDSSANDTSNKLYLYPFPYSTRAIDGSELDAGVYDQDRFAIILKHSDTNIYTETPSDEARYYKLNLLDKVSSTLFDVEANHSYRVVITAVNSRGYDSLEEAYQMPPSNIEYEIYDEKGGLTYSNGQYAISMDEILSYDEVLVYSSKETTLEFNNIRYVLPYGGEMDSSDFITNEVTFNILNDTEGLIVDTSSDFTFDADGKSTLTSEGQSITITLSGEGECTIALRILLGNLEMGREEITIKKIATNGDGDGSFDAHPGQLLIKEHEFVEGSWQSDDIDFGARSTSSQYGETDGQTLIYMGENATPTGYRTMDGYVSGQYSVDSYPVFSPKTRKGYYSYLNDKGETVKVMIQLDQLAPFYLGHFGNTSSSESLYHYNGLICEKIEEVEIVAKSEWETSSATNGVMVWSEAQQTYYKGTIWGDYLGLGERYHNLVDGLEITKNIVENNTTSSLPSAAHYCYMKNDVNGNGIIEDDEPIVWYLPAQNQLLAMWINMNIFDTDDELYQLNNKDGDSRPYYWSCSEVDKVYDYEWTKPSSFSSYVIMFNMLEGQADYETKDNSWESGQCHIRCVRGLD